MGGQRVDRCGTCAGIFFDYGELESILRIASHFDKVKLPEPEIESVPVDEIERTMLCPADGDAMEPRELGQTIIDECPRCQGIWLDADEICALKLAEANIRENLTLYLRLGS